MYVKVSLGAVKFSLIFIMIRMELETINLTFEPPNHFQKLTPLPTSCHAFVAEPGPAVR